jgi:hypothetical protein
MGGGGVRWGGGVYRISGGFFFLPRGGGDCTRRRNQTDGILNNRVPGFSRNEKSRNTFNFVSLHFFVVNKRTISYVTIELKLNQ